MVANETRPERPLVVTQGDPLGIGPELIVRACAEGKLRAGDRIVAHREVLMRAAECGAPWAADGLANASALLVDPAHFEARRAPTDRGTQVDALEVAMTLLNATPGAALVTAPIDKAACREAGFAFPGHTEYLAAAAGVEEFAMALVGPRLKVALVTIHEALAHVPACLTEAAVCSVGRLLGDALQRRVQIASPVVGVLGLNPHAGERGTIGREEIDIIAPAIAALNTWGGARQISFEGPLAADTAFPFHAQGRYDGLVAMYHDQGLGPFKLLHFHDGVNLTLGLPFVRTSPDHGTAPDLVGTGSASPESMYAAIALARELGDGGPVR